MKIRSATHELSPPHMRVDSSNLSLCAGLRTGLWTCEEMRMNAKRCQHKLDLMLREVPGADWDIY
jgi:hypothetical protein